MKRSAYKMLDPEHVEMLMDGRFRFGSLRGYAAVENDQIRDDQEGVSIGIPSKDITINNEEMRKRFKLLGINCDETSVVHVSATNVFIRTAPPFFAFCYSVARLSHLRARFSNYKACVEIVDTSEWAQIMHKMGSIDGNPIARVSQNFIHRPIEYTGTTSDLAIEDMRPIEIFKKAATFAPDCEHRIALGPMSPLYENAIFVDAPDAARLLRRVF